MTPIDARTQADRALLEQRTGRRRRPAELRRRLLDTGAYLFARQGYESTTYRQITAAAGVSDSVLFRHFGSKDQLLIEAVVEPFAEFLTDFTRRWNDLGRINRSQVHPLRQQFISELFEQLRDHREPLRAMLTVLQSPSGALLMREVGVRLDTMIDQVRKIGEEHDRERGRSPHEVELTLRLVVGMVVTSTVLDDWLVHPGHDGMVVPDQLASAMVQMVLAGGGTRVLLAPATESDGTTGTQGDLGATEAQHRTEGYRRSPGEVRESLIAAARELFADPGYGATSYRDIAEAADASESALFRHFGSKIALADEAVFAPIVDNYAATRARWTVIPADAPTDQVADSSYLLVELYRFFLTQREQLRLLMGLAHDPAHHELNQRVNGWFADILGQLVTDADDARHRAHISALAAMALSAAALDDWFLPHSAGHISTERILRILQTTASTGRGDTPPPDS